MDIVNFLVLFIRNKLVETSNVIYRNLDGWYYIVGVPLLTITALVVLGIGSYLFGYLIPYISIGLYPEYALDMTRGTTWARTEAQISGGLPLFIMSIIPGIFLFKLIRKVKDFPSWIRSNIKLAKNGIKVKRIW